MPTEATVYRVLLAMPDDVETERRVASDVLIEWNSRTGRKHDIHVEPVDASHVDVGRSDLSAEIDVVLGVFRTTVDDATGGSNLVDAVRRLAVGKEIHSIIGFSEQEVPTDRFDATEYEKRQALRDDCRETEYFTYSNCDEYEVRLTDALMRTMDRLLSPSGSVSQEPDHAVASEYDPEGDYDRLQLSADTHRDQDERNIERIVERFHDNGIEQPYRVLDAGCGYGTVTRCRFGDDERFEVVAIDGTQSVLQIANDQYSASNIEYRWLDVNNLATADLGEFDLVFSSYLFHHIANQESVLSHLWDHVREGGAMLVRSCDDGQHLHYPPDEDVEWVVDVTDTIPGSSDRTHGRRLPTHLKRLSPPPADVWMDLQNYHTVGRNSAERREYWEVFHSSRLHYANVRADREAATRADTRLCENMAERMDRFEARVVENEHVFDAKSVPLAVALK